MIYKPETTINPKKTSYQMIFLPLRIGSKKEAKNAPVDKQANVMETFETFIALKKVNQCNAITNPAKRN